ncbi:MAG: MATE family efflux transporter [Erysipelotrichaceae bacterium]|nr:MATE family efflux transporter [Erysipelotrichaceae bacterium]
MNKDLTIGNPQTVLWKFCLPLFGSIIFQQLYNIADSLIAGKFIGENALAAVGNSYEITLIFIAFAFGCNMGCSVVVSRLFGAKDYSRMKSAVYTALIMSGVICLALMLFGILAATPLLDMIHTPLEVFADSKLYLDIYVLGLPFVFFYNIANGIFSALGDSKTPFKFLAVSSVANIIVDIIFVKYFKMGVAGVAWATFLCQGVSCFLAMSVVFLRLKDIHIKDKVKIFDFELLKQIIAIAIPSTLQQSFISIGNILIQGVINGFGAPVMAGYSAGVKLNNLVITSFTTLANGISNYTSQNLGANKLDRIKEGFKAGIKMVWTLGLPLSLLYFFGGELCLRFFLDNPTDLAVHTGVMFLRILSPFYFVVSTKLIADGILRGSGNMNYFMIATFTDLILRVVLAFIFSGTSLGATGIWCAWPIGWTIATFLSVMFYKREPWIN